ncbi:MFS general substrate transporter, partial [Lichtheimia hyalospora FSU 10163]
MLPPDNNSDESRHDHDTQIQAAVETEPLIPPTSTTTTTKSAATGTQQGNVVLVFLGLQIALFAAALEYSIVSTALPRIGSDLKAMSISSWIASSYLVTQNAFNPVLVKLSDIFGRKNIMLFSISTFAVGSFLCGVAQSMIWLIVARAFQGVGAAGIGPMIHIIIADIVPLHKRANYQALIDVCFTAATLIGPFIGGTLTDYVSWRGVFFVNIPVCFISMAIIGATLHLPRVIQGLKAQMMRIDYAGNVIVLCASVSLTLALSLGSQDDSWGSPLVMSLFTLTAVLVGLLIYIEKYVALEPVIPLRLFTDRTVACLLVYRIGWGMALSAYAYYLPLFFQVVRGDTAMLSGLRLIPVEVGSVTTTFLVGRFITRTGKYRLALRTGSALFCLCFVFFWWFDRTISWTYIYCALLLEGIGMGGVVASSMISIQASVRHEDIAVASGLGAYISILGSNLGVATASAILNTLLKQNLPRVMPMEYAQRIFDSPQYIYNGLPTEYIDAAIDVYSASFTYLWYTVTACAFGGFLCSLFVKQYSLRGPPEPKTVANYQAVTVDDDARSLGSDETLSVTDESRHQD